MGQLAMSQTQTTLGALLAEASARIGRVDAFALLGHLLSMNRAHILAHLADPVSESDTGKFEYWVELRVQGMPVAYILKQREFYGREFIVSQEVLIPRPETEVLVEQALARLGKQASPNAACVLDLGTGSGAIAITLALESGATVTATDHSDAALKIAIRNATTLDADVAFLKSDWYASLGARKFDMIVANPPYVAAADPHLEIDDLRFEPRTALSDGSADGLDSIRHIAANASRHLNSAGWLLFEHGYDQAERCRMLLSQHGFAKITSTPDLAGIPRVTAGQWVN